MLSADEIRAQLEEVTIHEVCHAFAALSRGDELTIYLRKDPDYPEKSGKTYWNGRVKTTVKDDDKFLDSVYGWAGIIGEAIAQDHTQRVDTAIKRAADASRPISDADRKWIQRVSNKHRPESAIRAYEMLMGSWNEIMTVQKKLISAFADEHIRAVQMEWTKAHGWGPVEVLK